MSIVGSSDSFLPPPPFKCSSSSSFLTPPLTTGLGHFVILDDKVVEASDLGNNFFLTKDSLGKPRASETTQWLRELNPDVQSAEAVVKVWLLLLLLNANYKYLHLAIWPEPRDRNWVWARLFQEIYHCHRFWIDREVLIKVRWDLH